MVEKMIETKTLVATMDTPEYAAKMIARNFDIWVSQQKYLNSIVSTSCNINQINNNYCATMIIIFDHK